MNRLQVPKNRHTLWFSNKAFIPKILLPAFLTLALFVVSLFLIVIPRFEEITLGRKREMIRELTNAAWHVADRNRQEVRRGAMTTSEAQELTISQIGHLRYGDEGKDYFWITDFRPVMIVHPFREDLNGTDLTDFTDSRGKKLFVEIVKTVRAKGEGYVDYTWQWKDDSTRIVPKLSYVKSFAPWGWIIGTGIYIEDVKAEIEGLERNVISISVWISVTITLFLLLIVMQNLRSERRRLQAQNDLREAKEKYEALVGSTTEGLIMMLEGERIYYNKPLLAMCGYSEEETQDVSLRNILPDIDPENTFRPGDAEADGASRGTHIETRLALKDGSHTEVLCTSSRVHFFGKTGTVVIVKDISLHKEMTQALDESRHKFLALTNKLSMAMFRTKADKEMRLVEANLTTAEIFGFSNPAELQGRSFSKHFEDDGTYRTLTRELSESGYVTHRIVRFRREDHTCINVSLSIALVKDEQGNASYYDVLAEDVTGEMRKREDTGRLISELQLPSMFLDQPITPFIRKNTSSGLEDSEAARSSLLSVDHSSSVFDVLALYDERGARCVTVTGQSGEILGTVSVDDIQESHSRTYDYFLRRLHHAESVTEVEQCLVRLRVYLQMLIDNSAGLRSITHATTIVFDAAVKRIISLAIEEHGSPPVEFAFIALGSEGRSEQTLATDQDNAIVYVDVDDDRAEAVHDYFLTLGKRVCGALDVVGFPFCKGNVMAMNPKWCRPLATWKGYFSEWVNTARPQDLLDVSIFFDFRCIFGSNALTGKLREHVFDIVSGNNAFFVYLTQNALRIKPPTWQFKAAESVDIKKVLLPIVEIARIYSLKHNVRNTNTLQRLRGLYEKSVYSAMGYREISLAYTLLMQLRFQHQSKLLAKNVSPDNVIHTSDLAEIEKVMLRRILSQIENFQTTLSLDFKGTIV